RRVEQALLGEQHERALGMSAPGYLGLGRGDLRQRPAEVNRARAPARGRPPRDRAVEREVELEDPRAVPVPAQAPPVPPGKRAAGEIQELARSDVQQLRLDALELGDRLDPRLALDPAGERAEVRGERVRECLR